MKMTFPRTALLVLAATMVSSLEARAGSVRLADEYHQAVVLGEKAAKTLGSRLLWVGDKRQEIEGHLRQYWSAPCDEAMVFAEPAPHAGEVMLSVVCKSGGRVQMDRSIPERRERVLQDVPGASWNQFVERATQWTVSGPPAGLDPEIEATLRSDDREHLNSFAPLLAIYRDGRWFVLPMRVWETFDLPRVQRSRWQEAMIDLLGLDRKKLDARDEERRADRGRRGEGERLDAAIRSGDIDGFKQVFDGLAYLPRDSYLVYRKLIEAMAKGHEAMVIHAMRSGTPAYLTRDATGGSGASTRPDLARAVVDSISCRKCTPAEYRDQAFTRVARWSEIAKKAEVDGGSGETEALRQQLRQQLEVAVVNCIRP
jgi:hypothetical protein